MSLGWMVVGGSALVAYALLAASVLWGLVLSLGVLGKSGTKLSDVHEALSVGALFATLVHMAGIAFDGLVDFDPAAILVLGRAPWRPVAVACGVVAFYGMLVIIFSFHIRKHIGQATWRAVHYLSFGVFLAALIHGVTAGSDTAHPAVFALYVGTAAAVSTLVALRILMAGNDRPERTPARPAPRRPLPAPDPGTTSDTDPTLELPAVPRSV